MESDGRRARARDFILGGLLGASAAFATARRGRTVRRRREEQRIEQPAGLAAFEGAPCFEELLEQRRGEPDA
jgi:hypothetical protein